MKVKEKQSEFIRYVVLLHSRNCSSKRQFGYESCSDFMSSWRPCEDPNPFGDLFNLNHDSTD